MYHSVGDTETYVSAYPLTGMIRFDFKRADQILLRPSEPPTHPPTLSTTPKEKRSSNLIEAFPCKKWRVPGSNPVSLDISLVRLNDRLKMIVEG